MTRPKFLTEIAKRQEQIHFLKVFVGILLICYGVLGLIYWGIKV
jgi:hypothetical protein